MNLIDPLELSKLLLHARSSGKAVVSGTGRWPVRLNLSYSQTDANHLRDFLAGELTHLQNRRGIDVVVSGGAVGFDQALGWVAVELDIPLVVCSPFDGQDVKWPPDGRRVYRELLEKASFVTHVCSPGYAAKKFITRDCFLVDHCSFMIALLDDRPEKSGTGTTVEYARKQRIPIENLWARWTVYSDSPSSADKP